MNPVDQNNAITIPRTDAFMERFSARLKFLMGDNVRVGAGYHGWETLDGHRYDGACRVVRYDGTYIYVYAEEELQIVLLQGDAADYRGRIVADRRFGCFDIRGMHEKVVRYMEEHCVGQYDSQVGRRALWLKMAQPGYIQLMVEVYELGRSLGMTLVRKTAE
uniref:Uncharacterized protein n=1 Tax=uncultured bacterium Contig575 TaxID=1393592 RepID=W0FI06_9BACT|nr:hypothetical protein [uncultured bacterium Contig575]